MECGEETTHGEISGAGIISLNQGCKLYTALTTLSSGNENTQNISHPIITVDLDTICFPEHSKQEQPPELIPIKINNIPLDSLKTLREEIKIHTKHLNKKENFVEKHSSKFSYISFIIGLILMIFTCLKCCKINIFKIFSTNSNHQHRDGCIQIFNNCFDRSQRRQQVQIPMASLNATTSCISEDEDEPSSPTSNSQTLGKTAQSLF